MLKVRKDSEQEPGRIAPALEPLPDDIQPIFKKMRAILGRLSTHSLLTYYELGKLAVEASNRHRESSRHPLCLMDWLAAHLDINVRTLYLCVSLVERIPEDVYRRIATPPLNWSHVRTILNRQLESQLDHWVERIKAENLTADAFEKLVRRGQPSQRPGSGRRPAVPKTFRAGLAKYATLSARFGTQLEQAFFCDEFDLAGAVVDVPPDEITDEVRHAYAEVITGQEQMAHALLQHTARMRQALQHMDQVLEGRRQQEAEAAQQHATEKPGRFGNVGDRRANTRHALA